MELEHLPRIAALAAVFGWPFRREPTALGERTVQVPVVVRARLVRALGHVGRAMLGEERAHLQPEVAWRVVVEGPVHGSEPVGHALELVGWIAERERPRGGTAKRELNVLLEHESVPTVHVKAHAGCTARHATTEPQRHRREHTSLALVRSSKPRQQGRPVDGGGDVGESVLECLERADRHAELLARRRVVDGELQRPVCETDERGGGQDPPFVERGLVRQVRRFPGQAGERRRRAGLRVVTLRCLQERGPVEDR